MDNLESSTSPSASASSTSPSAEAVPAAAPSSVVRCTREEVLGCAAEEGIEAFIADVARHPEKMSATAVASHILLNGGATIPEGLQVRTGACGKLWGANDIIVKCVTCQGDRTCGICVECFDEELHKGHDWRFLTSHGGMCDCGDESAWARSGTCEKHRGAGEDHDPLTDAPADLVARCQACVRPIVAMLKADCGRLASRELEQAVTKYFRFFSAVADAGSCTTRIVAEALCEGAMTADWRTSPLHVLVSSATQADLVSRIHEFLSTIVADNHMKRMCALEFVRTVGEVPALSDTWATHLSVQFLTVSSVVNWLQTPREEIEQPGIFQALATGLLNCTGLSESVYTTGTRHEEFGILTTRKATTRRAEYQMHLLYEISYCVSSPEYAKYCMVHADVLRRILMVMLLLQQAHCVFRVDSDEDSMENTNFEYNLFNVIPRLCEAPNSDMTLEEHKQTLDTMAEFMEIFASHVLLHRDIDPQMPWINLNQPYKDSTHGVFFQLPLHRLFAAYCSSLLHSSADLALRTLMPDRMRKTIHTYAESVLSILVTRSQVNAGMWRRDHMGVERIIFQYSHPFLMGYFCHDVFFMQMYAVMCPTSCVAHIAHRHGSHQPLVPTKEDEEKSREHNILDSLLRIILQIATDRTKIGEPVEILRQRVIHALAIRPMKNSELQKLYTRDTEEDDSDDPSLQVIINECAEKGAGGGVTEFALKPHLWTQVNPYFIEWVRPKAEADAGYVKVHPKSDVKLIPCTAPNTVHSAFRPLWGVLNNEVSVSLAVATVKGAGNKLIAEDTLRAALDILTMAVSQHDAYAEGWAAVFSEEDKFYAGRRPMEGVANIVGSVVTWPEPSSDGPTRVADVLSLPDPAGGPAPISYVAALAKNPLLKDLHHSAGVLMSLVAASGEVGAACVEALTASSGDGGAKDKDKGGQRKAKGKARQKAAMSKMQSQRKALEFDMPSSDEEDAQQGGGDGGVVQRSAHHALDSKWLEGENCSLCNMAASPNGALDIGMICLATKTRGMEKCFRKDQEDDVQELPKKKGKFVDSASSSEFPDAVQHSQDMVAIHSCGHFVHLDCLESNLKEMKTVFNFYRAQMIHSAINGDDIRRGFRYLNIAKNEYLCPLCGRIANFTLPIISPKSDDKTRGRQIALSSVMTEVPSAEDMELSEEDIMESLETVIENEDEALEPVLDVEEVSFNSFLSKFSEGVSEVLYGAATQAGSALVVFAQQAAFAEIATRMSDSAQKTIPLKKLISLRTQLKAIVAERKYVDSNANALRLLLGKPPASDFDSDSGDMHPSLLTSDVFSIWVHVVLGIILRVDSFGHAAYRFVTKLTVEALLVKLVLELQTASYEVGVDGLEDLEEVVGTYMPRHARATRTPAFDVEEYLAREMAITMTWMGVAHSVITAPLDVAEEMRLPSLDDPAAALSQMAQRLGLDEAYTTLAGIASSTMERDTVDAETWLEAARRAPVKPVLHSNGVPSLIQLPEDYVTLMNRYLREPGKCGNVPTDPALCLKCAEVVCCRCEKCTVTKDRVRIGPCQQHAIRCGGGQSVFLRIKSTMLLVLDGVRFCDKVPSPYVDSFGEDDPDLGRGRPLTFNAERYNHAQYLAAFGLYGFDSAMVKDSSMLARENDSL